MNPVNAWRASLCAVHVVRYKESHPGPQGTLRLLGRLRIDSLISIFKSWQKGVCPVLELYPVQWEQRGGRFMLARRSQEGFRV